MTQHYIVQENNFFFWGGIVCYRVKIEPFVLTRWLSLQAPFILVICSIVSTL